jgi:hypothetical protein
VAEDLDRALVGRDERGEDPDRRRLARAVRAEEADDLARRHLQVDAVDGHRVAEALAQSTAAQGRRYG